MEIPIYILYWVDTVSGKIIKYGEYISYEAAVQTIRDYRKYYIGFEPLLTMEIHTEVPISLTEERE